MADSISIKDNSLNYANTDVQKSLMFKNMNKAMILLNITGFRSPPPPPNTIVL